MDIFLLPPRNPLTSKKADFQPSMVSQSTGNDATISWNTVPKPASPLTPLLATVPSFHRLLIYSFPNQEVTWGPLHTKHCA